MPAYKYQTNSGKTLWYCSFHYVDWTGENKRKKKSGFEKKKDAADWEAAFLNKLKQNPEILFSSLLENYMKDCESHLKPTTISGKEFILNKKILPFFENMKVSDVSPLTIRKWQNELINYRDEDGNQYSVTYLRYIHAQMSTVLNYAVKYYGLQSNPCRVSGPMGKLKPKEMHIWTREQFEKFIPFEIRKQYRVAFNILFYTGMRAGELLALTPQDIPTDRNVISITKNYVVVKGVHMYIAPKTEKSVREVFIHKRLHDEIITYIKDMMFDKNDRLFQYSKSSLLNNFHQTSKKADCEQIRIHDLRHSHASMLIDMNIPIIQISERLGHENVQTTLNTYAHLYPGRSEEIADKIESLFETNQSIS